MEALVTWGADVDMDIPHLGTALYTACVCQELECARKLLREGQLTAQCGSLHLHTDRHTSCMNIHTDKEINTHMNTQWILKKASEKRRKNIETFEVNRSLTLHLISLIYVYSDYP